MWVGPIVCNPRYIYEYDDSNGRETLSSQAGIKIADIFVLPMLHDSQSESETVTHVNFLKCIVIDHTRRMLLCELPGVSVKDYLKEWRIAKSFRGAIMSYTIPTKFSRKKVTTTFLAPVYRDVIRQLYTFVVDQHVLGDALTDFSLEDLWIKDGELKVSGVGFIEANQVTRGDDFNRVLAVMEEMLGRPLDDQSLNLCPPVVADLVKKTRHFNFLLAAVLEKFLANHLAIIPPSETIKFIRACSSGLHNTTDVLTRQVLSGVTNHWNWEEKFAGTEYYYVKDCFVYNGSHPNMQVAHYDQTGCPFSVKISMLRFVRNMAVHLRGISGLGLENLQIEVIIMKLFHEQLLTTQSRLHQLNRLGSFMKMV